MMDAEGVLPHDFSGDQDGFFLSDDLSIDKLD